MARQTPIEAKIDVMAEDLREELAEQRRTVH
jgi:hypothetical protein